MYDKYLKVNDNFKPSINLLYDMNNDVKLSEFVPTSDLCDVLKKYVKSALDGNGTKSTLLSGPYGKGKSYLILVLSFLLSNKEDNAVSKNLMNKISQVDPELTELVERLKKEGKNLLPVVVNNNSYSDVNQNFMLALHNALTEAGISEIIPDSVFSECINVIKAWEKDPSIGETLDKCEGKYGELSSLKTNLSKYSKKAYDVFCEMFRCVNHGYSFNPLVGNDMSMIYDGVARKIRDHGYAGLFVVFDEFGAFLENQTVDFPVNLNKIQAFAEKANSSSDEGQLHFCCITHKDFQLYQKENKYSGEFEKISGRFEQIRFDRSLEENYQIICGALRKEDGYKEMVEENRKKYSSFLKDLCNTSIFMDTNEVNFIWKNCFPLNPVTLYSLVQLSERIAQNERTLFTYISDNDRNGFKYYLANNEEGMINVDSLYDYFQDSIKDNAEYKSLYFKAESLIRSVLKEEERSIIKTIAIIKIINDDTRFTCKPENIALCLGISEDEAQEMINAMIESNKLKKNVNDGTIDFSIIIDQSLNDLISRNMRNMALRSNMSELLNGFDKKQYFVSHKYNLENLMTRFFKAIYLETSTYKQLTSTTLLFEQHVCDGLIINLINDDESTIEDIKGTVSDTNVLVRFPAASFSEDARQKLLNIATVRKMLENTKEYSDATVESLNLFVEDRNQEVQRYLDNYYEDGKIIGINEHEKLNDAIYECLTNTYSKMVKFNNEQVNKHEISSVITKARNSIIDNVLEITAKEFSPTSAEATIRNSFEDSLDTEEGRTVVEYIRDVLINGGDEKIQADSITNTLIASPYGMRKGVVPLFVAKAIDQLTIISEEHEENVLLYNKNIEVAVNADNLTKMMINPANFFFSYKKINKDRLEMMDELKNVLGLSSNGSFMSDVTLVVGTLKRYVSNLPSTVLKATRNDNVLGITKNGLAFKDILLRRDLNAFDLITNELPNKFGSDITTLPAEIKAIMEEYDSLMNSFYESTLAEVEKLFLDQETDSLHTSYNLWKNANKQIESVIFENDLKKIYQTLNEIMFNNNEALNALAYAAVGSTLDDFNTNKKQLLINKMSEFVKVVSDHSGNAGVDKQEILEEELGELSSLGNTLYTNIQEVIEEYGFAISNEEKTIVLKKLIKDILK